MVLCFGPPNALQSYHLSLFILFACLILHFKFDNVVEFYKTPLYTVCILRVDLESRRDLNSSLTIASWHCSRLFCAHLYRLFILCNVQGWEHMLPVSALFKYSDLRVI